MTPGSSRSPGGNGNCLGYYVFALFLLMHAWQLMFFFIWRPVLR